MHRPKPESRRRRSLVLHPFLLAAFPVLFLFAHNREEGIGIRDVLFPLGLTLGAIAVLFGLGWLLFRNLKAVALVVSVWALLFFSYGRVAEGLGKARIGGVEIADDAVLLSVWAALAVAAIAVAYLARRRLSGATTALNVVGAVLVAMNLFSVVFSRPTGTETPQAQRDASPSMASPSVRPKNLPDIYYIVPEDYGHPFVHRQWFGIDTSSFERYLRNKGFYVADRSMSNYQNTHQSLASSLNMEYLNTLVGDRPTLHGIYAKLQNFKVANYLQSLGYRYVHIGSWYKPTAKDPTADINLNFEDLSEFSSTLYQTTVLPPIFRTFGVAEDKLDPRRAKWKRTIAEFDLVGRVKRIPGPKFVFAHLMFPHYQGPKPPEHTIDRNGNFITKKEEERRSYRRLYGDGILFAAKKMEQVIDSILADPNYHPIIVLQTDEGAYPNEKLEEEPRLFDYSTATKEELRNHFLILNAYYVPGMPRDRLYPTITPVNSFRLIFDQYFHGKFPLFPDKYFARRMEPYGFVDITKLLRNELRTVPARV
ncbi:MAG TPA: hypothetical protein VF660_03170 [Actinomycetota bacterium]|jgi:hypothetical protein